MAKNAASEERMGILHLAVAETLIKELDGKPILDNEGNEIGRQIDARVLSGAISFLNNNKVTMNPYVSEALSEIEAKLKDRPRKFAVVRNDAIAAAKKMAAEG